jgi:hypothetical protein
VCTLRAAIQETNALPGADTINLPSGNFLLSIAGQGENAAASGDLDITDNLTIVGAGGECSGVMISLGHNLDRGVSCGLTATGDLSNADPLLGPTSGILGDPTRTLPLLPGSPAIDAGDNNGCPTTDQRGLPRPVDGNGDGVARCDMGAFEAQKFTVSIAKIGTGAGTVVSDLTGIDCGADCSEAYPSIAVTLTAIAAPGSVFAGWSGGVCMGTHDCTLVPTADTILTAIFVDLASSPPLVAAVLPSSRSASFTAPKTTFATVINAGSATAMSVRIALNSAVPAFFHFQATDPMTNFPIGTVNTPVDIAAGASQTFVIAVTPSAVISPTELEFSFAGINAAPAPSLVGINTLLFAAAAAFVPDIVALAATLPPDPGIVNIPGANGLGFFAVATVNTGAGGSITASADQGSAILSVNISLCETDPATGQCISGIGPSVTTQINANATPTFGIFVQGTGNVPFDPAANRIFVRFSDVGGVTRGATSVAFRTQ